jgi:non-heme chloroperoxidase
MRQHVIEGGGGARLHAVETGDPGGRPIVFIHGLSQCLLCWNRQLHSDLAKRHRLVAFDLRGHGRSDKPADAYGDSRLWADDIAAVIRQLRLDHPVLCGWSYGPLAILDYVRHHGEDAIAGINVVGGVTKLGSEDAASVLTADFLGLVPGFFSDDAQESVRALDGLIGLCFASELSAEDRYLMLGYGASVPPYVRRGLLSRALDNDDLLPKLRIPVLITHGADDAVVKPEVIARQMSSIPRTEVQRMAGCGHACFWDDAPGYNRHLGAFAASL